MVIVKLHYFLLFCSNKFRVSAYDNRVLPQTLHGKHHSGVSERNNTHSSKNLRPNSDLFLGPNQSFKNQVKGFGWQTS